MIVKPFPVGFGMQNFDAILTSYTPSYLQPWNTARPLSDSCTFSIGFMYINYYDKMDNAPESGFHTIGAGMCYINKICQITFSSQFFSALSMYNEYEFFLSVSRRFYNKIIFSIDGTSVCMHMPQLQYKPKYYFHTAFSSCITAKEFTATVGIYQIPLYTSSSQVYNISYVLACGLHSARNSTGSQGVLLHYELFPVSFARVSLGYEFILHPMVSAHFGLTTNPFMLSCGFTFSHVQTFSTAAAVFHPILGLSKGLSILYAPKTK